MIPIFHIAAAVLSCVIVEQPLTSCVPYALTDDNTAQEEAAARIPYKTGDAIDVALSAESAFVWDVDTGTVLYDRNSDTERPVASLNKLVSSLAVRELLPAVTTIVEIPAEVRRAQALGANIRLPAGQHASVQELLAASLVPSANDAMVALAIAARGSEEAFVHYANDYAARHGLFHTKLANSTGLQGGTQYSTARDVKEMLMMAYADPVLRPFLSQERGSLTTQEGTRREYVSTDKLLGTYLSILAGKTGYTLEAKENLAIIAAGPNGQKIGAVILGSDNRFQDTKTAVEYVLRNYTWP